MLGISDIVKSIVILSNLFPLLSKLSLLQIHCYLLLSLLHLDCPRSFVQSLFSIIVFPSFNVLVTERQVIVARQGMMGNYARRNEGNDSYLVNQQMTVSGTYNHPGGHEFGTTGSGSYHFPQHSFNPYGSQFGPSYGQSPSLSTGIHHLQYASDHTIPSMATSDEMRVHHSSSQYMPQARYLQSPRYLPLRDPLSETDIEDQESHNEGTILSEPVLPPLDGFPDVKEFDQLMCRSVYIPSSSNIRLGDLKLISSTRIAT